MYSLWCICISIFVQVGNGSKISTLHTVTQQQSTQTRFLWGEVPPETRSRRRSNVPQPQMGIQATGPGLSQPKEKSSKSTSCGHMALSTISCHRSTSIVLCWIKHNRWVLRGSGKNFGGCESVVRSGTTCCHSAHQWGAVMAHQGFMVVPATELREQQIPNLKIERQGLETE